MSDRIQPPIPTMHEYYRTEAEKPAFVRQLFDATAGDYDAIEQRMAFGTGSWYRRRALSRSGLKPGMRTLDVAIGTGLVAREAIRLIGNRRLLVGVDPSAGMLGRAVKLLGVDAVQGFGERLPLAENSFDFLSMGYALRHLTDLVSTFREFFRVLRPGGRVCILEISRPASPLLLGGLKLYMKWVVPALTRIQTGNADTQRLWRYYWETIEACVPPETVMQVMREAGFVDVGRFVELGMFSEYTGRKP